MDLAHRPHRGGTVLGLGILSLVAGVFVPVLGLMGLLLVMLIFLGGGLAWRMGSKDLAGMNQGRVDPAGRTATQLGRVFGISALVVWFALIGFVVLSLPGHSYSESSVSGRENVRNVRIGFTTWHYFGGPAPDWSEYEYQEVLQPDGDWVKEGPYVRRSRGGTQLEAGTYRDGKREGAWTYWDEYGGIDVAKSGMYEADVRVSEPAPSPLGDFPLDEDTPR